MTALRVLVVTGGHPFERDPFLAMFAADPELQVEHVEHPAAQERLHPDRLGAVDVVVLYDMPGLRFTRSDPPLDVLPPSSQVIDGLEGLLRLGTPFVVLHHALASWPAWPRWADIVGGRFHYRAETDAEHAVADSGYLLDVTHRIEVVATDHPVCAGLPTSFELTDELYLIPALSADVVPLLRTTHPLTDDHFWSTDLAIRGRRNQRAGWRHPPGPDLVAWTRQVDRSRLVYLQPGDGPSCYADANYRLLLGNAIRWAANQPVK